MTRLNVETSLWSDPRFQSFMIRIGDQHRAIGMVIILWILAQQHWCPNKELIPFAIWNEAKLPEDLIDCGLAERRDSGIYARGSEKQFQWWFERQEAGRKGGLKSAESRRSKLKQDLSVAQPNSSKSKQSEPSSSSSSSFSKRKRSVDNSDVTDLWNYYSEKIDSKGLKAVHEGAKTNTSCSTLVKKFGLDQAKELMDAYFRDDSQFVKDKAWPLGFLVSQQQNYFNKIQTKAPEPQRPLDFGNDWSD